MKKLILPLIFLFACTNTNTTTNNSSQVLISESEQLDCHDPALDVCTEPDYSKDVCEVAVVDVYVTELQCKDNSDNVCR